MRIRTAAVQQRGVAPSHPPDGRPRVALLPFPGQNNNEDTQLPAGRRSQLLIRGKSYTFRLMFAGTYAFLWRTRALAGVLWAELASGQTAPPTNSPQGGRGARQFHVCPTPLLRVSGRTEPQQPTEAPAHWLPRPLLGLLSSPAHLPNSFMGVPEITCQGNRSQQILISGSIFRGTQTAPRGWGRGSL